jgi:hypothetical protein
MITVLVCHKSTGNPAKSIKVALGKDDILTGGVTRSKWTDAKGESHFDAGKGPGQIFVQGHNVFSGYLNGRHVVDRLL